MAEDGFHRFQRIAACPSCRKGLLWSASSVACEGCGRSFPLAEGIPDFAAAARETTQAGSLQAEVMQNRTLMAKLYTAGRKFLSSEYMPVDHVKLFVSASDPEGIIVELGSGNRRLAPHVVNIDLFPFLNVDVTADITRLPLRDNSVDGLILDTVLEHVPEPPAVVDEVYRVLKPGGRVVCIAPFIFPYHDYPKHYYNFSRDGLEYLFRSFSRRSIEINMGPTSALVNLISEYAAVAFGGDRPFFYAAVKAAALLPLLWLKYLDVFWQRAGRGTRIANLLCINAVK
jgi:SAM-dependent methyltransferase